MNSFFLVALVFIAVAFAFVLPPLWGFRSKSDSVDTRVRSRLIYRGRLREIETEVRSDSLGLAQSQQARRELEREILAMLPAEDAVQAPASSRAWLRWIIVLALPAIAFGAFQGVRHSPSDMGETGRVQSQGADDKGVTPSVAEMVLRLQARLQTAPGDARGWELLGRSMAVLQRFAESAQAYEHANTLTGYRDPDMIVAYAESLAFSSDRRVSDQAMDLLEKALQLNPRQPKALWLAGWGKYQRKDYKRAVADWKSLENEIGSDPALKDLVTGYISDAMKKGNISEKAASLLTKGDTNPGKVHATVSSKPRAGINVHVAIGPALQSSVSPEDTVFIFARLPEGIPAPLALVRRQARDLPLTIRLDDSKAMIPTHKLSDATDVVLTARISKRGMAMPQSGDLEGVSPVVAVKTSGRVDILINHSIP